MADDDRADETRRWLQVEPLDEVTRRRLVSTALATGLSDRAPAAAPTPERAPSRSWRWIAAAAAGVVVVVGGLALLTARGGHDEQVASRAPVSSAEEKATTAAPDAPDVGDFGDLDQPANLVELRNALGAAFAGSSTTSAAPPAAQSSDEASSSERSTAGAASPRPACARDLPAGARVVARAGGTIGGRHVTVVLTQLADGSRTYDAVFDDSCEVRPLGTG